MFANLPVCRYITVGSFILKRAAATSFGKSIAAQIAAIILSLEHKLTIIIEPLTALSHDQVKKLQKLGIAAAYLDSTNIILVDFMWDEVWIQLLRRQV